MDENEMVEKLRWLLVGGTLSVSGTSLTIDFETREEAEMAMDALERLGPDAALSQEEGK